MSKSQRKVKASSLAVIPTPSWVTARLLEACSLPGSEWFEPAVGYGHIVRAVDAYRNLVQLPPVRWTTNDILKTSHAQTNFDIRDYYGPQKFDVIATNPPFSLAEAFFNVLYPRALYALALLLPVSWLGTAPRARSHRRYAPTLYVLPERPRFRGGSNTDQEAYAWFVWRTDVPLKEREHRYVILPETPLDERRVSEKQAWDEMPTDMKQEHNVWRKLKKSERYKTYLCFEDTPNDEPIKREVFAVSQDSVRVSVQPKFAIEISLDDGRQLTPRRGMQMFVPRRYMTPLRQHAAELFTEEAA